MAGVGKQRHGNASNHRNKEKWRDGLTQLSPHQMDNIRRVFKKYDKNSDGSISIVELRTIMQVLGNNPTDKEIRKIMRDADKSGNGRLEFDEFAVLMARYLKDPEEEELELMEAFRVFDKDESGYITKEEIKELLKSSGERLAEEQLSEIFEKADLNGDGRLDYKEFVKLMTNPPELSSQQHS